MLRKYVILIGKIKNRLFDVPQQREISLRWEHSNAYSVSCQTSKIELFTKRLLSVDYCCKAFFILNVCECPGLNSTFKKFQLDTHTYVCVSGGKKCLFFGKFGVLCFLETPVLRIALWPYYRRIINIRRFLWSLCKLVVLVLWVHFKCLPVDSFALYLLLIKNLLSCFGVLSLCNYILVTTTLPK